MYKVRNRTFYSEIDPWSLSTSIDRKENGNSNRHEVQLAVTEEKRKFNFFDWYQLSGQFDLLAPNDDSTNPKSVDDPALSLQPICLIRNELVLDYFEDMGINKIRISYVFVFGTIFV